MKTLSLSEAVTANRVTRSSKQVPGRLIDNITDLIMEWQRRRAYRADLRRLSRVGRYMIRDIGLTPEEASYESRKPFWKP